MPREWFQLCGSLPRKVWWKIRDHGQGMCELAELLYYFTGFWLFLFNRKFRKMIGEEWNSSGVTGKFFIVIGAISSTLCGLILPLYLFFHWMW